MNSIRLKESNGYHSISAFNGDQRFINTHRNEIEGHERIYDKERIDKLAQPRSNTKDTKTRRKLFSKSIGANKFSTFLHTLRNEKEKSTIQSVHTAYIYGVNLTQVPLLKEQFCQLKKNIKEPKLKKNFRKTMMYFKKIGIVNKKLLATKNPTQEAYFTQYRSLS